ncbi:MAG: V-type ATPase subunit [Clostridiales bacterium]|nr:V-type ATPase subunit [Clostridiales bacterium]
MLDTNYAFAVAKIRYNELSLLTEQEFDQLVSADGVDQALRLLADKGWNVPENGTDCSAMLEEEADKAWTLLKEAAPDIKIFDTLILSNDFHNLKASIKCLILNQSAEPYFISPSVADPKKVDDDIRNKNFENIPPFLRDAARDAYEAAATNSGSGMLVDLIVDRYCMEKRTEYARMTKSKLLYEISELKCFSADIKTALRSAAAGKDGKFMRRAMADNSIIEVGRIIEAALKGRDEIVSLLETAGPSGAADAVKEGNAAFEKWCDDAVTSKIGSARSSPFGAEPLIAYYLAKDTEIKNVRIIISAKQNGRPESVITERVRKAYA